MSPEGEGAGVTGGGTEGEGGSALAVAGRGALDVLAPILFWPTVGLPWPSAPYRFFINYC